MLKTPYNRENGTEVESWSASDFKTLPFAIILEISGSVGMSSFRKKLASNCEFRSRSTNNQNV